MEVIALLLLAIVPVEDVQVERVDAIELFTLFDDKGRIVFDQLIFREWDNLQSTHVIRDWRLVKGLERMTPKFVGGEYVLAWMDGSVPRVVKSSVAYSRGDCVDPEVSERGWLPKDQRSGLLRSRVRGR